MPTQAPATVVVPVRNACSIVVEQLDALFEQVREHRLEVVVVDDASNDGTPTVVEGWIRNNGAHEFRVVRRKRRGGPNASRNVGVRAATADLFLFCDGDDVVADGWAAAMLAAQAENVILCGALVDLAPSDAPREWPLPPSAWGVPYAYGGNMAVSRAIVEQLGGFDDAIRSGGTEFDLSFRAARDLDVAIVPVGNAVVRYRFPTDLKTTFVRGLRSARGRCYLRSKFGPGVIPGRTVAAWLREWRRLARLIFASRRDPATRTRAASKAGSLLGRLFWSIRYRVKYL